MCINLETSIIAFGVGELSGLYLATSDSLERKLIGYFIMFYSLVQMLEGLIYYYGASANEIYSRLILLNLGFQGLIFFVLMNQVTNLNPIYLEFTALISLIVCVYSLSADFKKVYFTDCCLNWGFLDDKIIRISLSIMYVLIFYWLFTDKQPLVPKSNVYFLTKCGIVLGLTFLFSKFIITNNNNPSMWCLASAISAPIMIFI